MSLFLELVFKQVKKIPLGKITTYKEIAKAIGNKNASRAVGNVLNKNRDFENIPCHRVIKSNGEIGGYIKGQKEKRIILKKEGIKIVNNKINLTDFLFKF
ncbi:MAG: MGMT family protein [Candidatus ainarchaeum sp.]|nr:MGMT family protein [Candidatus ainarchaeum sp.]